MSGGGGNTQTTSSAPWGPTQPYLREGFNAAYGNLLSPPAYYPGQTFQGPTAGQIGAWDNRLGYADQVFGGQQAPKFGEATGALSGILGGGSFGQAGGLDARNAIQSQLSGRPDYAGAQGAVDAANAPLLRQFEQDIIPGLNQKATFLNNSTGGIKTLNRVLPELGERMSQNAAGIMNDERLRALQAQQGAAGLITQGGANADANALRGVGLFPTLAAAGEAPGMLSGQFADWGANFGNMALNDQMNRFNYYQGLPNQSLQQYMGLLGGMGNLGGTSTTSGPSGGGGLTGAAGGAMAGAQVGSMFGPGYGTAIGAGLGGLLGMFG